LTRAAALLSAVFVAIALASHSAAAQAPQKQLTVEDLFAHGPLVPKAPETLAWSPDGKHLTYLDGGELMDVDPVTGKVHVMVSAAKMASLDGSGGSEQDRDHRDRYNMAGYLWAPDSTHLLFDADGRLWLYDLRNGTGVQIGFTGAASGDDPKFSPDGSCVSFIRDHSLSVVHLRNPGTPSVAVAPAPSSSAGKEQSILNGEVDWVYEEELDTRSNYFWSPDSKNLAYLEMNETTVPQYPITDWIPTHAQVDMQRYPQPGDANPEVRVGVVSARGGKTTWMKIPIQPGDYIPRFGWVNRNTLWVAITSIAPCISSAPNSATRARCSRLATRSFLMRTTTWLWAKAPWFSRAGATDTPTSISTATTPPAHLPQTPNSRSNSPGAISK
jgi:dipeptidyl-peptidase-4